MFLGVNCPYGERNCIILDGELSFPRHRAAVRFDRMLVPRAEGRFHERAFLDFLGRLSPSDVLVTNFGLHYNEASRMTHLRMPSSFSLLCHCLSIQALLDSNILIPCSAATPDVV